MLQFDQKRGVIFLLLMIIVSGAVIFWTFFLNKGSVVFTSDPPFTVSRGWGAEKVCGTEQCVFRLSPGKHVFKISKDGHISQEVEVTIHKGEKIEQKVAFRLSPSVKKIAKDAKGVKGVKDEIALFYKDSEPRKDVTFSKPALVEITFGKKEGSFIYLSKKIGGAAQELNLVEDNSEKQITVFSKEIKKAHIFVQDGLPYVIFVDATKAKKKIYLVDIEKLSKKLLVSTKLPALAFASLSLSEKYLFLADSKFRSYIIVLSSQEVSKLSFSGYADWLISKTESVLKDELIFVSNQQIETSGSYIEFLGAKIRRPSATSSELTLYSYSPEEKKYSEIVKLPQSIGSIKGLVTSKKEHVVYLMSGSDEVYEVSF